MAKSKQVLLKRSNVKGKVPALSAMTYGEMFLNYNDGVLMSKSSSNAVLKWSDDSKMATKNELNLKLDKIEAEGSYVKNATLQNLVSEIEDNERVITTAFEKFRESAGFNENGESTLGKSLTEAISELDGVKALANKVTVDGDTVKITTLSANTFSANTVKVGSLSANTFSANTVKVGSLSANTLSAATIRTTNLSATTVSAHTIKSLTMSANTISGNTIRATAMSANTLSANTVKIGSLSASTIKSTTTDELRKDIDILSGETYVIEVPIESLEMSTDGAYYFSLTEDEFEKIKNVRHLYLSLVSPEQENILIPSTCRSITDMVYAFFTASLSTTDTDFEIITFMMACGEISDEGTLCGYIHTSSYDNEKDRVYELKIDTFTSSDKPEHNSYADLGRYIYDIKDYKVVSVDLGALGKYLCAPMIYDDKITLHCYTHGEQLYITRRNGIEIGNSIKYTLTIYSNSPLRCYITSEGFSTNAHSESALTSCSAITTTSAKTSNSAVTSTKWSTGRKITLSGDATGNVTLDGSQNVTLNVNVLSADTAASAKTVTASGVNGVLSSSNMPTTISKTIRYTAIQHFDGDIHVCGDGTYGGAIYFGNYDNYHDFDYNDHLVYIREKDNDILDIIGNKGVRIGNLVSDWGSDASESYDENYAIIVDENGSVTINDLVGYATSDEVDENNEILTKALNRLNTSAGFNSLGESTLPSGMSLTKAILELQKGGGVADKVNVTESSSKSYIVSRETTDSDETSLHYDSAIWSENGQLYASSDKNLKEHVGNVDGNPELIKRIPKVFYHWKDDEQKRVQMGTYAQDIEKVYPEVVSRDDNGNLAVGYDRLSVIALAGIDELYKMIQDLKEENKQLRKELDSLKK